MVTEWKEKEADKKILGKIIFAESLPWDSDFFVGSHEYATRFAQQGWEVFWVHQPVSLIHWLAWRKWRETKKRFKLWWEGPQKDNRFPNFVHYSPFTLIPCKDFPLLNSKWVGYHSINMTFPSVTKILKSYRFDSIDLFWLTNPFFLPLRERIDSKLLCFRISDDIAEYEGVPMAIRDLERRAVEKADFVFVTNVNVLERIRKFKKEVVYLPNGVDFKLFSLKSPKEPLEYKDIKPPRVIYVGNLNERVDFNLLKELAQRFPQVSIVLIGPAWSDISFLHEISNVYYLGPRLHMELPGFMQHADVAIIPFVKTPLVESIHPIKLYEYLAAGLPVVATRWREIEHINSPAYLADNREEFFKLFKQALSHPRLGVKERIKFAEQNSWGKRFEVVLGTVLSALGRNEL